MFGLCDEELRSERSGWIRTHKPKKKEQRRGSKWSTSMTTATTAMVLLPTSSIFLPAWMGPDVGNGVVLFRRSGGERNK
jgi:hypothetical protein